MSRRLPLLHKTPFVLDPRPLAEASSAHAGLLSVSRAYRSLEVEVRSGKEHACLHGLSNLWRVCPGRFIVAMRLGEDLGPQCVLAEKARQ
jgi:hypothetical protein